MVKFKQCFEVGEKAYVLPCYNFAFHITRAYGNNDRIFYGLIGLVDNIKKNTGHEYIDIAKSTDDINQALSLKDELEVLNSKYEDSETVYLVEVVIENDTYRIIRTIE